MNEEKYSVYQYSTDQGTIGLLKVQTNKVLISIFFWNEPPIEGYSFLYKFKDYKEDKGLLVVKNPIKNVAKCMFYDDKKVLDEVYVDVKKQTLERDSHKLIYEGFRNEG